MNTKYSVNFELHGEWYNATSIYDYIPSSIKESCHQKNFREDTIPSKFMLHSSVILPTPRSNPEAPQTHEQSSKTKCTISTFDAEMPKGDTKTKNSKGERNGTKGHPGISEVMSFNTKSDSRSFIAKPLVKAKQNEKQSIFDCDQCNFVSSYKRSLDRHIRKVHIGNRNCVVGPYRKASKQAAHLKPNVNVHNKVKYKCEICGKLFGKNANMETHIMIVHNKIEGQKCDTCGKSFRLKFDLKKHIRRTHGIYVEKRLPNQFLVKDILDHCIRDNEVYYRVSWEGFGLEECTWEPRSNLKKDVPHLVKQFEEAQKAITSPGQKHCVCRGIDNGSLMIHCDVCQEWFHASCLEMNLDVKHLKSQWKCQKCVPVLERNPCLDTDLNIVE